MIDPAAPIIGKPFCICPEGYEGDGKKAGSGCTDIDECSAKLHNCSDVSETCINKPGGFRCECRPGFKFNSKLGFCEDINECMAPLVCGTADASCLNMPGSFLCSCNDPYKKYLNGLCKDRDVCTEDEGRNNPCDPIHGICVNEFNIAKCLCKPGFELDRDGLTCIDIDECSTDLHGCPMESECENLLGGYRCACKERDGWENVGEYRCGNLNECEKYPDVCPEGADCCLDLPPPRKYACASLIPTEYELQALASAADNVSRPNGWLMNTKSEIHRRIGSLPGIAMLANMTPSRQLQALPEVFIRRGIETIGHVIPKLTGADAGFGCPVGFDDVRDRKRQAILARIPDLGHKMFDNLKVANPFSIHNLQKLEANSVASGLAENAKSLGEYFSSWYKAASEVPAGIDTASDEFDKIFDLKGNAGGIINAFNRAAAPFTEALDFLTALGNAAE